MAPPHRATHDSWAIRKWQQSCLYPSEPICITYSFLWIFDFVIASSSQLCYYCDHNSYFCVAEIMILWFCSLCSQIWLFCILVESWKVLWKLFWSSRTFLQTSCIWFRVCVCVCVCPCRSWCVVVHSCIFLSDCQNNALFSRPFHLSVLCYSSMQRDTKWLTLEYIQSKKAQRV